ncbi:hypothetical protein BOX15_Mlig034575g1 [Macrostomum lignano]|uniref:Uncharacterized protein n=2 Tax=Macrostomum lignano TaxID=282301 RepID=A0A267G7C0_9PLAT|nr:hypothetical protein BOX15_Mlig034575g1 [Macrostomum lignano]
MRASLHLAFVALLFCSLAAALPGSNPCSRGPGHWCSSLAAARACGAIAHCAQLWSRSSNLGPDPADATESCTTCRLLADDLARLGVAEGPDGMRSAGATACGLVADPSAARACQRLLTAESANLPELLAAGLQPGRACVMAGQCRQQAMLSSTSAPATPQPPTASSSCSACPSVLEAIGTSVIRVGVSPAHAVARLRRQVCPTLANKRQRTMCRKLAGRRDLFRIVLQLARGVPPKQVCTEFRLCSSAPFAGHPVIQLMQLQTNKAIKLAEPIECQVCEDLVNQARQMLRDGRTQAEIESFVESIVCNALPSSEKDQCVKNVQQYGPILFQLLASELDPKTVCEAVGACGKTGRTDRLKPKLGVGPQCLLCEFVMREVDKQLSQNATQAEIEAALLQVCSLLPQTVRQECDGFVQQYTPIIIQLLVNGLSPQRICTVLGLCTASTQRPPVTPVRKPVQAGPQCLICEFVMREVDKQLGQNATQAEIETALLQVCSVLPQTVRQECDNFVQQFTPTIIQLLVNGLSPQRVCSALGLCSQRAPLHRLAPTPKSSTKSSSTTCDVCQTVMQYAKSLLQENATEQEIVQLVERVCSFLPTAEQAACKSFINEYGAYVIQLLLQDANPRQICQLVGLCTTTKMTPPVASLVRKPARASPQCLTCEFVMREVEQQLSQNATQTEIESALQQVCSLLPQTVRQECDGFVQQYTPIIIQLLVNGLSPQRICTVLGLCTQVQQPVSPVRAKLGATSTACDTCQTVVVYVKSLLKENATEQEIIDTVEKVCNFLPTAERPTCKMFVDQYGPYVIQLLLQDLNPMQVCQLLGLCTQKKLQAAVRKQKQISAGPQCLLCEFVMREVDKQLSQNATQTEIEAALLQVCSVLPQTVRQECDGFVQQYTPIIIQLLVNGLSPQRVCSALGLCSQRAPLHRLAPTPKSSTKSSSTVCDVCQTVMQYAKSLLQENATEQEIVQLVERVCSFLPTAEQAACKSFINEYGAYVIQLLLQDANPRQICQLLGLCTNSRSTKLSALLPDRTLRFVQPARGFPATANGMVQMVRDHRRGHRSEPVV